MKLKGFKAFNKDLKCMNDFQYEIGKNYTSKEVEICKVGFHFCQSILDLNDYYPFDEEIRICEIVATRRIFHQANKSVTSDITIVRELPFEEWAEEVIKNGSKILKHWLLKSPYLTEKVFGHFYNGDDVMLKIDSINCGPQFVTREMVEESLKSENVFVKETVIKSGKCTLEQLTALSLDESMIISRTAKEELKKRGL